jgi:hypothetical protein
LRFESDPGLWIAPGDILEDQSNWKDYQVLANAIHDHRVKVAEPKNPTVVLKQQVISRTIKQII